MPTTHNYHFYVIDAGANARVRELENIVTKLSETLEKVGAAAQTLVNRESQHEAQITQLQADLESARTANQQGQAEDEATAQQVLDLLNGAINNTGNPTTPTPTDQPTPPTEPATNPDVTGGVV